MKILRPRFARGTTVPEQLTYGGLGKPVNLLLFLVMFASLLVMPAAQGATGKATVRWLQGEARVVEGSKEQTAKVGKVLREGATIKTSAGSQAALFLGDNGPVVHLAENTTLVLDKLRLDYSGSEPLVETELNLKTGKIFGKVKTLAKASNYEVKTPVGVAGFRGAQYVISANGKVTVLSGQTIIAYANALGVTTAIAASAGETFTPPVNRNENPSPQSNVAKPPPEAEAALQAIIFATTLADPNSLQATVAELASVAASIAGLPKAAATPEELAAATVTGAQSLVNQSIVVAYDAVQKSAGQAGAGAVQAAVDRLVRSQTNIAAGAAANAAAAIAFAHAINSGGSQAKASAEASMAAIKAAQTAGGSPAVVAQAPLIAGHHALKPGATATEIVAQSAMVGAAGQSPGIAAAPPLATTIAPGGGGGWTRRKKAPTVSAEDLQSLREHEELWIISKHPRSETAPDEAKEGKLGCGLLRASSDDQKEVPLPLEHTDVKGQVDGYIASVDVKQRFQNPFSKKIEAEYVFPLPVNAAVSEFVMIIGERRIRGIIRERKEAEEIYEAAREQGYTASLLTQERPNIFTQKVANIEPGKTIDVQIRYFHALSYSDGWFEFVFPMVVGPRFNPPGTTDGVGAVSRKIPGASGQATEVSYLSPNERSGHDIALELTLRPGLAIEEFECPTHKVEERARKLKTLTITLAGHDTIPNKDFVFRYRVGGNEVRTGLVTHRDERGGFFSLMLFPPNKLEQFQRSPVELIFVVDTSGSMSGAPLENAKKAIEHGLKLLDPDDSFQIINFSDTASQLGPEPLTATRANIKLGIQHARSLQVGGGTMMIYGIRAALKFTHDPDRLRYVCFLTDGYIGNENEIFAETKRLLGSARIFSFGIGSSVNRFLLDGLADMGQGLASYLTLNENPEDIMQSFFDRISHPALTKMEVDWGGWQISDLTPKRIPDLFVGRPFVVTGRFKGEAGGRIRVRGMAQGRTLALEVPAEPAGENSALPQVWARQQIGELEKQLVSEQSATKMNRVKKLALDYGLASTFTSFVAVDASRKTKGSSYTRVKQAVPTPIGVNYGTTVQRRF